VTPIILPAGGTTSTHTFSALRQELADRGFSYLTDARLNWLINAAYTELNEMELWPWRDTTATGAAPLTIADLGVVGSVVDTQALHTLVPIDRRQLLNDAPDLTTTGSPMFFYVTNGVVNTYPVGGTLSVRYFAATLPLSGDSDLPVIPDRFIPTIVDIAVRRGYLDDENFEVIQGLQVEIDRQLELMREVFLWNIAGRPPVIADIAGSGDW
jgi:hypothetical protein